MEQVTRGTRARPQLSCWTAGPGPSPPISSCGPLSGISMCSEALAPVHFQPSHLASGPFALHRAQPCRSTQLKGAALCSPPSPGAGPHTGTHQGRAPSGLHITCDFSLSIRRTRLCHYCWPVRGVLSAPTATCPPLGERASAPADPLRLRLCQAYCYASRTSAILFTSVLDPTHNVAAQTCAAASTAR